MVGVDGVLVFTATPDATRASFTFEIRAVMNSREVATEASAEVGEIVTWTFRSSQAEMFGDVP